MFSFQKSERDELQKRLHENPITKEMTPEEKLAEKLRRQKLVEASDLENTKELLGLYCFYFFLTILAVGQKQAHTATSSFLLSHFFLGRFKITWFNK